MNHPTPPSKTRVRLLFNFLSIEGFYGPSLGLLCALLFACGSSDPLQEILKRQRAGEIKETIEPMRELLAERRGDAKLLFIYGRALSAIGQQGLAEWSLRESMKDPEWLEPAGLLLATNAARGTNYVVAIEAASRILEADPDNINALLIRSSAYTHSRIHHEEALADSKKLLELDPDNIRVMESQILALIGLDRIDEVTVVMAELGRKIDDGKLGEGARPWHCATMAIFAGDGGDDELADSRWTDCLEKHPGSSEVVPKAVQYYDSQQKLERSMEILRAAVEADPNVREYRVSLAQRMTNLGSIDAAEALLLVGTENVFPELAAGAWTDLGKHYQTVENYPAAAEAIGQAVAIASAISTPKASLLLEYADALLIAGQYEQALEIAGQMTSLPHQEVIRARVAQEQRNYALALEHFEAAFRLWPNNPWSRYYAAQAAEAIGDFDRAVEQYRYSIRIAPGATDARTRVAQIHWAEDRTGVAIQLLRVKAHEVPLVPEGELLSLELFARTGRHAEIVKNVKIIREGAPPYIGRALARAALGLRDRSGAAAAVEFLRTVGEIDVADLDYAEALRALVQYSVELSEAELVAIDLEAALAANPDAASPRETAAFLLELTGASEEKVRQAYQTVLEIEPENALALAGLGRLSLPGEPERALAYFDRSAASNPDDLAAQLEAARALVALGRSGEAEERLNTLLDEQQFHGRAAALLAELQFERGLSNDRTLDLAKRSVRFGGGVEDLERLARVHEARNEPAESQQASERAKKLGEKQPS